MSKYHANQAVQNGNEEFTESTDYEGNEEESRTDENTLTAYLRDMKEYHRISRDRELILGKRIKMGKEVMIALVLDCPVVLKSIKSVKHDVLQWLNKVKRPNLSEREALIMMRDRISDIAAGSPKNKHLAILGRRLRRVEHKVSLAVNELVTANLRLVVKVAKEYMSRGLALEDLIQEGNMGLIKAAMKYDFSTGYRFSTYAIWWIRQSVTRAIYEKSGLLRLPVHLLETRNTFHRTYYRLLKELGREPAYEEVATAIGTSVDRIVFLTLFDKPPLSLDAPIGDEDVRLADTVFSDDDVSALEAVTYRQLCETVREVLAQLPDREEKVLRKRFGIGTDEKQTLEQVGQVFNISRERVRQLENQALSRMRHKEQIVGLNGYM